MLFTKVTKEHILQAISDFLDRGYPKDFGPSLTHDMVYNDKEYPPKVIMAYANYHAEGRKIKSYFKEGVGSDCFKALERNGFLLIRKADPFKSIISRYKAHISTSKLEDEIYKWQLLKKYRDTLDPDSDNFIEELKSIDFSNLTYAMSKAVLKTLVSEKPEEIHTLFKELFNEDTDLNIRVKRFNEDSLALYRVLEETLQHHQDERSISTYLTFYNPNKYTFYKYSFYKKYCKLLGVKPAKKNEKYSHYLHLINVMIDTYIKTDQDLINQVKECIPEYYDGTNHLLLAQDILYQMLEKEQDVNYWIFQGNPAMFDFKRALEENILENWTVTAHKDKIKVGDKVILWMTGHEAGCYALAEVTTEPILKANSADDYLWKTEDKNSLKAGIRITHNLLDHPITISQIIDNPNFTNLKVGNQGTNFSATEQEYWAIESMIDRKQPNYWLYAPGQNAEHWDSFYENGIMALGWDDIGDITQYASKQEIKDALTNVYGGETDKRNDITANDDFANKIKIGDIIIAKNGRRELLGYGTVSSNYFFDEERDTFKQCRKVDWKLKGKWKTNFSLVLKTLTDITVYKTEYSEHEFYYQTLMNILTGETGIPILKPKVMKPINQILYGPPGTGKTFYLKDQLFEKYTSKETSISLEQHFDTVVRSCSWWQVVAIALLDLGRSKDSDIFNHAWVQKKASLSNSNTIKPTLWGQLQAHTIIECEYVNVSDRQFPLIFNKTKDSYWEILEDQVTELVPELYELKDSVAHFDPDPDKIIKHFEFVTFHQSFAYEDFIEGIKPILPENEEETSDLGYTIEDGVFKNISNRAKNDPDNRYAIFIDEINRGNVSAIFGELITLIETDKRLEAKDELQIKLPYSKKDFGVPSNLDIYGTMNTADRSVEALDTALRRRFEFKEMAPRPELLDGVEIDGIYLKDLMININSRIEKLIDKDHCIGHSYFLKVNDLYSLKSCFRNHVIPLLEEYFYGDFGKIGLVLGNSFVEKVSTINFSFSNFNDYDGDVISDLKERPIYKIREEHYWDFKAI